MSEVMLEHKIALGLIPGIGDINARKLVSHFGSVEAVFKEPYKSLIRIPGIGDVLARSITDRSYLEKAEKEAEYVTRNNIKTFFYLDENYPARLKQCEDSPVTLFYKGSFDLNAPRLLSVVGTRNATSRGKELCEHIISGIALDYPGTVIVSGLAYGVDVAAHKSALKYQLPTIAVLGHGFSTIYPSVHAQVAEEILSSGGLLTDFASDELPERNNFIKRNRIIAGLSDATLVIESGLKGGALITADIAASYNRDVFAIPGRTDDQWSSGCNFLIKRNKAALVENSDDIGYLMNWMSGQSSVPVQKSLFVELTGEEKLIYDLVNAGGEQTIDHICRETKIPVYRLSSILLKMEFDGLFKCLPGNIYRIA